MKRVRLRDPSEWIRNVQLMVADDSLPHCMAFAAFDSNDNQLAGLLKTFRLFLEEGETLDSTPDAGKVLQGMASEITETIARDFQTTSYITVLIVHEDLHLAQDILTYVELGVESKSVDIGASIITDNYQWIDVNDFRVGEVDRDRITDYQLEKIINGDDNISVNDN